jgi:predicted nucleotidyltransferase component of viral defense system
MDFDEIRRHTIVALFSDDVLLEELVLKGGNAISLIYGFGNRASLDLDFSLENDFEDVADAKERIFKALEQRFSQLGLAVFDTKFEARPSNAEEGSRWGGYQFEFKLIAKLRETELQGNRDAIRRNALVVGPGQQRIFRVDLSKHEFCGGKVERELDNYTIYVYTPEMIVIEKLRAICQQMPGYLLNPAKRGRARDFYDIHLLVTAKGIDLTTNENVKLLREIFQAKDVPLDLLGSIRDDHEIHRIDWPSVRDSVSPRLGEFDYYVDFVSGEVARILEALRVE